VEKRTFGIMQNYGQPCGVQAKIDFVTKDFLTIKHRNVLQI
jgi:hypothetical protein